MQQSETLFLVILVIYFTSKHLQQLPTFQLTNNKTIHFDNLIIFIDKRDLPVYIDLSSLH